MTFLRFASVVGNLLVASVFSPSTFHRGGRAVLETPEPWGDASENPSAAQRNDEIVGCVFRWSLACLAAAGVVALFTWLLVPPPRREGGEIARPVARQERLPQVAWQALPDAPLVDVAQSAGIDFVHVNSPTGRWLMPENVGGGCAFFDFDDDGDQDVLLVHSGSLPGHAAGDGPTTMGLYRNDGRGRFDDVSSGSGLDISSYGMGCAIGDADGDGRRDVFITCLGRNHLFRNLGDGRFADVTENAGVAGNASDWSTCAVFFDYDRDGWLDLYVGNYVAWDAETDLQLDHNSQGVAGYLPPWRFSGTYGYLYHNEGQGRFRDVSQPAGIRVKDPFTSRPAGKSLGACTYDLDGDGWLDLVVANDQVPSFLFHNQRDGTFKEIGRESGVGFDYEGFVVAGMGVDAAPIFDDERLAVGIANIGGRATTLYVPQGGPLKFADQTKGLGVAADTYELTSFGLFFFDFDLDGRMDLFQSNGSIENQAQSELSRRPHLQPCQVFWNCGDTQKSRFALMPAEKIGPDLLRPIMGRGAAYGDIDGDADPDVLVLANGGRACLFRNEQRLGHHWLRLDLRGRGGNREAIGAKVAVVAGGRTFHRQIAPGRSYLSYCELPLTVGLGEVEKVDRIEITWPGGTRQTLDDIEIDAMTVVNEPEPAE